MKSLLASIRDGEGIDRVDHAVQLLEDEWRRHGDVRLERLWKEQKPLFASEACESIVLLSELIKTDLRCRFARGQTPAVADYLARFPELDRADTRVLSLIYEEFCLVEERGDPVDVAAFCDRYPRWKESLVSQLEYHHLLSQAAGARPKTPPFPEAGDTFEEFQLISLLGRGGMSRVFVARDLSLGGKQVVLKISLDRGREPQAQGALDHPHIVPVNSVVFGDGGMRGLSMPYRPGLPLDEVIRRVAPASRPARAIALWEALVRPPDPPPASLPKDGTAPPAEPRAAAPRGDGWEGFPVRGTYAQGVAWIVKVIAEALHYAHRQRTFHRDVKPANVLLTVQHGPQLLDFNLAESPHSASQAQAAMHGGTLPYMAPEQIEAFLNPELWGKVGAQADIYSLGLVLREMLTGQAPDLPAETLAPARAMRVMLDRRPLLDVTVRKANPAIPHALEAIVGKCLAVNPEDRYPDAGALVEDLDRFLRRRPLVGAVNPSRRERYADWMVRNRLRLSSAALATAACLIPLAYVIGWSAARSTTVPRPSVRIERSPELQSAMALLFDKKQPRESLRLLEVLAEQYPDSAIPRMLLSLAHDALDDDTDAQVSFNEAISLPDARSELVKWKEGAAGLTERLATFVDNRIRKAHRLEGSGTLAESERKDGVSGQFRLAKEAAELALEIRPNLDSNIQNLAFCEVELGQPESALRRVEEAMNRTKNQPDAGTKEADEFRRQLFIWRGLRGLAFTKLAEQFRAEPTPSSREKALDQIALAENELALCSRFLTGTVTGLKPIDVKDYEEDRVLALMTRVELELELGRTEQAERHFQSARGAFGKYRDLSVALEREERLAPFEKRLTSIDARLREAVRKPSRDSASAAKATGSTARG